MNTIQDRINDVQLEIQQIKNVKVHLQNTNTELKKAYKELKRLDNIVGDELEDVEKLESISMKGLFYKVLGSKKEQIEKERQEYLQASLKYNEFNKTVEVLEYEKQLLETKLQDDTTLRKELQRLKSLRENEILRSDPVLTRKLSALSKKLDTMFLKHQNIASTIKIAKEAEYYLGQIITELHKARQWGNWDMMGRNRVGDIFKYGAIDRAKNLAFQAKQKLYKLNNELKSMGVSSQTLNLSLDHFSRFTDIFFDNLISDWIIQQKIVNALSNVKAVKDRVTRLIQSLESEVTQLNQAITSLKEDKERILLT